MYEAKELLEWLRKINKPIAMAVAGREDLEEIRIRARRPAMVRAGGEEWVVTRAGTLARESGLGQSASASRSAAVQPAVAPQIAQPTAAQSPSAQLPSPRPQSTQQAAAPQTVQPLILQEQELNHIFLSMNENSVYAYQEEVKQGYLTIKGGHRIGIVGKAVLAADGSIQYIKEISGFNIRVAKAVKGCGQRVLSHIIKNPTDIYSTLIVSPPGTGKTTLLRDLTRILSDGSKMPFFQGLNMGVVDERSEIAACYKGVPQNDVGKRTDVLDACPKATGMLMLLRSMAPNVIVVDEIGGAEDAQAIRCVANAGVRILATAHGYGEHACNDLRKDARDLIREGIFQKIIVLDASRGVGTVKRVLDGGVAYGA